VFASSHPVFLLVIDKQNSQHIFLAHQPLIGKGPANNNIGRKPHFLNGIRHFVEKLMVEKVLFVDDNTNLLTAIQRNLRKQFDIVIASSPAQALDLLRCESPFSVIVSDLRMPHISGVELSSRTAVEWPDTVRILLTGEADTKAAIAAVNEGHVYRFLTKPFPLPALAQVLTAALAQYRLITTEKVLLEKTLSGSVKVLTEVLCLTHPLAFSRASRIRDIVKQLLVRTGLSDCWEFEMAAMLSQIGCISLSIDILQKLNDGAELSPAESALYKSHPATGCRLLENIPRLETVARIIEKQEEFINPLLPGQPLGEADRVLLGTHLLKLSLALDHFTSRGLTRSAALAQLQTGNHVYPPELLKALAALESVDLAMESRAVRFKELTTGMVLKTDIVTKDGSLLLAKGHTLTSTILECLERYFTAQGIQEPIGVLLS
jgi:CheY-like chemotaxis protein